MQADFSCTYSTLVELWRTCYPKHLPILREFGWSPVINQCTNRLWFVELASVREFPQTRKRTRDSPMHSLCMGCASFSGSIPKNAIHAREMLCASADSYRTYNEYASLRLRSVRRQASTENRHVSNIRAILVWLNLHFYFGRRDKQTGRLSLSMDWRCSCGA